MMSRYKKGCSPSVIDLSVVYTGCDIITCTGTTIKNGMTLKEIIILLAQDCYEPESVSWGDIIGDIEEQTDLVEFIQSQLPEVSWGNISGDINEQTDLTALIESFVPGWGDLTGDIESQQDLINYLSDNFYDKEVIDNKINDVAAKSTAEYYRLAEGVTTLPTNPEQGGVELTNAWTWLVPGVTYTVNGVEETTPDDRSTRADWDGTSWSLVDMGELPMQDISDLVTKEEFHPIESLFIPSPNLIDRSTLIGALWSSESGSEIPNVNRVATPKISLKPNTDYVIKGLQNTVNSALGVFFNETGDYLPALTINGIFPETALAFTTGAEVAYGAFNLSNVIDAGLDPSNSTVAGTVMLAETADINIPYQPYGAKIKRDSVEGMDAIDAEIANLQIAQQVTDDKVDILFEDYDIYSNFNGVSSRIPLGQTYTLQNAGDFVEMEVRTGEGWSSYLDSLGTLGTAAPAAASQCFGIYDNGRMWLRTISGSPYVMFSGIPNLGTFRKIKLEVSAGGDQWDLYVDGNLHQSEPKSNDFIIDSVGNCYADSGVTQFAAIDLKYLNIKAGAVTLEIPNPYAYPSAVDVEEVYVKKNPDAPVEALPPVFVSFNPTGFQGRARIDFFVRRGETNRYVGHSVNHYLDTAQMINMDLFRIGQANEFEFNGVQMLQVAADVLRSGENECVYQDLRGNTFDFTGGYHGNEIKESINLYIDGVDTPLTTAFNLIPATTAWYAQKSTTYKVGNSIGGVDTPELDVEGNFIPDATHVKKTIFGNSAYQTINYLDWRREFLIFWYHGISCIGKVQALNVYNEELDGFAMTGSTNIYYGEVDRRKGNHTMEYFNSDTKLGATVTAFLESPLVQDLECTNTIWDRANDSKYYRKTPNYTTEVGVREKSVMTVTYHAQKN